MKRKYRRGSKICCIEELAAQRVVFLKDKPLHRSFFRSWQIRYVMVQIQRGNLYRAEKVNDDEQRD